MEIPQTSLLKGKSFLITGGAGFIGSNIVKYLLEQGAELVRVFDNLSTGCIENIEPFRDLPNFEFLQGDIRDLNSCIKAVEGVQYISHQAALGSVPRSIKDPINTNAVNIIGHLNMLISAKESHSLKRMVYAASSSSFGDSTISPKVEGQEGSPLSPYAVTKKVNEMYGDVFSKVYDFNCIGLRYFNVFGPNQSAENDYAAVIPLFMKAAISKTPPTIFGDGSQSRDFTFVENVVQANIKAMINTENLTGHHVINIAVGEQTSLNELWLLIQKISNTKLSPAYANRRAGDVMHSLASIANAKELINYYPEVRAEEGIKRTYDWFLAKNP